MSLNGKLAVGRNHAEVHSSQAIERIPVSDPMGVVIDEVVFGQLLGKGEPCSRAPVGRQVTEMSAKVDRPGTYRFVVSPHHPGGLQWLAKNQPVDPFDMEQALVLEAAASRKPKTETSAADGPLKRVGVVGEAPSSEKAHPVLRAIQRERESVHRRHLGPVDILPTQAQGRIGKSPCLVNPFSSTRPVVSSNSRFREKVFTTDRAGEPMSRAERSWR